jgi:hypothetical protein
MNVADKICEKAKDLPEQPAQEVLDFIEQLSARGDSGIEAVKQGQELVMKQIWENKEDDVWNEL